MLPLVTLVPTVALAQWIKGKVVDAQHPQSGLAGATIQVVGGPQGTVTDSNGYFSIHTTPSDSLLRVSFLGYRIQTTPIRGKSLDLTIALETDEAQNLLAVTVRSKYYKPYTTRSISSALRLKTSLLELSQNIQAVTPEILFDQGSSNLTENVTRNVSGATRLDISNHYGPYIFMRGGAVSTLRNGVDFTPIYRGPVPEDAAFIERIEFIKGPSLFMNNLGDPAGTFNVVTKQATGERNNDLQVQVGSFGLYRLAADLGGKLDHKGKLAYRLNAMGTTANSFVKFDFLNRYLIAPVLRYQFHEKTALSLEYTYQNMAYRIYSPTVASQAGYNTLPRDFAMTDPGLAPYQVKDHSAFLTFTHAFNESWSLTARGTLLRNLRKGHYLFARRVDAAHPTIQYRNLNNDEEYYRVFSQQLFVNGKFTTGIVSHQLLAGMDRNQKRSFQDTKPFNTYVDAGGVTQQQYYPLNIANPVYGAFDFPAYSAPGGIEASPQNAGIRYYSVYALDEIAFLANKLRLTVGGRYTGIETDSRTATTEVRSNDQKVTPRLGISYSLSASFSVYALYDQTLKPQTGITSDGEKVRPQSGANQEIGLKKNWFNNRFTSSLAVYRINRTHIAQNDPVNPGYSLLVGKQKARGIEIDLLGELARGLNAVINFASNDSKITDDVNPRLIGTPTGTAVRTIQNTWLNYRLPWKKITGLAVSLGYQYLRDRYERNVTTDDIRADPKRVTPDYFRLDGAIGWSKKKLSLNLNVNNLLNGKQVGATWYTPGLYWYVPQPPRNVRLTAGYHF
ncbi:TonB-dependent siderophore receptor [Larkinella harenae]